ncbi:MAG TPA: hypothetical protein VGO57_08250 [Verrucomicrobiae bacterium]|jgi:hypothetical protein
MTLSEITGHISHCIKAMDKFYGGVVFDEWVVVSLVEDQIRVFFYQGPREQTFLTDFFKDLGALHTGLTSGDYGVGDFEFSRHAIGTGIEAFMVLGQGNYLICNNTTMSMDAIAQKSEWLNAQVPFVELAEKMRANPLHVPWETKFFRKPK